MLQNAHDKYLEERVLSADPMELVRILYQAAIGAVQDARRHLAAGRIAERSRSISRASSILLELAAALDRDRGGEIADRLAALYEYLQGKLWQANCEQSDPPLAEVLGLLSTLAEGWAVAGREVLPQPQSGSPWAGSMATPEPAYASGGWSL
ncbi:MAG: flagellar export chaperone FliS [Terriglobia bacterium]|nr:MAG: flagellar export chaperone FliS [Terriglobia bacterium]